MCPENTALRFGKTTADYIQLPKGIMDNSTTRFSLCSWINKQYSGSTNPTVIENKSNFKLGDDGNYNKVTGTNLDLQPKYNRTLGTWFHVCMTWSNEDRRTRVYLNGNLIGTSNVTEREELDKEMRMCLGNSVSQSKLPKYVFGGDLFKLNIYNRVLTKSEIENIASDICSNEEQELASGVAEPGGPGGPWPPQKFEWVGQGMFWPPQNFDHWPPQIGGQWSNSLPNRF